MSSDERRQAADRPFSFSGTGSFPLFLCPACAHRKSSTGRRLLRFGGIRQWLCATCAKARQK